RQDQRALALAQADRIAAAAEIAGSFIFLGPRTGPLHRGRGRQSQQDHASPPSPERWGLVYRESRSAESRDDERALAMGAAVGPTLRHDLVLGPEAKAFLPVLADIAEAGALPAAEAVIADRHG